VIQITYRVSPDASGSGHSLSRRMAGSDIPDFRRNNSSYRAEIDALGPVTG
jgi:hypothetical protein